VVLAQVTKKPVQEGVIKALGDLSKTVAA